jgi:hypothetical protein
MPDCCTACSIYSAQTTYISLLGELCTIHCIVDSAVTVQKATEVKGSVAGLLHVGRWTGAERW